MSCAAGQTIKEFDMNLPSEIRNQAGDGSDLLSNQKLDEEMMTASAGLSIRKPCRVFKFVTWRRGSA